MYYTNSIFFFVLFLLSGTTLHSQCHKINFVNTSLDYVYEKAQSEGKDIFIFLYVENDSKADFFQSAIFYKEEVCSLFNYKFINVKATTGSQIGMELMQRFQVADFPSFIVIDKNRNLLIKTSTIGNTQDLLAFAHNTR